MLKDQRSIVLWVHSSVVGKVNFETQLGRDKDVGQILEVGMSALNRLAQKTVMFAALGLFLCFVTGLLSCLPILHARTPLGMPLNGLNDKQYIGSPR